MKRKVFVGSIGYDYCDAAFIVASYDKEKVQAILDELVEDAGKPEETWMDVSEDDESYLDQLYPHEREELERTGYLVLRM